MMNKRLLVGILFSCQTACVAQRVVIRSISTRPHVHVQAGPIVFSPGDSIIQLPYQQNSLILTFQSPGSTPRYAYTVHRLIAGEITTHDNGFFLPNLPNGEFEITIRDQANPHIRPARLRVIVEAPIWLRWWFLPLMFLFGLLFVSAGLYLLYRYRIRQFLQMQRVRDRIARDLHDDMGSYLSSISILSQTARRNAFRDPEKTQTALDSIGQTARQVIERMGDMVWSINPAHDSMADILTRMADVGNNLFDDADAAFNLSVADEVRQMSLSAEVRREFFLIYKEALTNVARYAGANGIRVTLRREESALVLTVQDNGCGFDTANPAYKNPGGGNGLRNMQARAKLIGGLLTIHSVPHEGTTVRLVVAGGGQG